jgi:16S rRNA (cytosine1402-N4)-methyltransferase
MIRLGEGITRRLAQRRPTMGERDESVHVSVLKAEILETLANEYGDDVDGWVVDLTLGAGGHSASMLERFANMNVLGVDQDPAILSIARERLAPFGARVDLQHGRFSTVARLLRKRRIGRPLAMLMDLGVSSLQLDHAERGFSFQLDGPLDMRMDPTRERTAADIVNDWDEVDLADLFFYEGDERRSREVARAIVAARRRAPFFRTGAFAELVAQVVGGRGRIHPATRVFQALRRAVNEEGEELMAALEAADNCLADGGMLLAMSFHSGEDGVVKRYLKEGARAERWRLIGKKPITPSRNEERGNPRSRSAKLRVAVRVRPQDDIPGDGVASTNTPPKHPEAGDEGGRS